MEAYRRLYIKGDDGGSERGRAVHIVRNLTALTAGATLGELASLEEVFAQFMAAGQLPMLFFVANGQLLISVFIDATLWLPVSCQSVFLLRLHYGGRSVADQCFH